jgi:hypothetical protein
LQPERLVVEGGGPEDHNPEEYRCRDDDHHKIEDDAVAGMGENELHASPQAVEHLSCFEDGGNIIKEGEEEDGDRDRDHREG